MSVWISFAIGIPIVTESIISVCAVRGDFPSTHRVCRLAPHSCHDRNQDVLLDSERAWIERDTEYFDGGDYAGPETDERERDELGDDARDGDGGISEEEELVEAWDEDGPAKKDLKRFIATLSK